MKQYVLILLLTGSMLSAVSQQVKPAVTISTTNKYYVSNKQPLRPSAFIKLPVTCFKPKGYLLKFLQLQRDGLMGNLGKISAWLAKTDNAWLTKDGKGKWGWEEVPYWLKGYAHIGYLLQDQAMIGEAKFWIDAVLNNQRPDGDFGPIVLRNGKRDLWTNMPMLWCMQSYYEYSNDPRVLTFMGNYFKWQHAMPDSMFLEDYWENSRGGDNMYSVYWLYNRTGEPWLLDLATKIDRNTANWRQKDNLPNWHNVNIVQSYREPATYYQQTNNAADLEATYNDFKLVRAIYGQVPGGLFGSDENARKGYDDPRQAVETCGMVEQMTSDQFLLQITGDPMWADNCEDIAFNTFPAAFMPDYRSLRYLTAPNMVVSDSRNHAPGIANEGPFLMMNPFSSRCCQHNHGAGWPYFVDNSWMATADNGLVAQLYTAGDVTAKVGDGTEVTLSTETHYPFDEVIDITVKTPHAVRFPVYLRIPAWCTNAAITVNGKPVATKTTASTYAQVPGNWKNGDKIQLRLPMQLQLRQWAKNKNSVSVNYGPLTFSLLIKEDYKRRDSKETAIWDSRWQENADVTAWPSYEIFPASSWNYGLQLDPNNLTKSFTVKKKPWPKGDDPFINANAPIELVATGKQIPSWIVDQYGLCGVLPQSPVAVQGSAQKLTLVPMGGARLRISAFPVVK
jgi:hypothetical protein